VKERYNDGDNLINKANPTYWGLLLRLRNDLYCVEWDVKLYYTIPFLRRYGAQ